MPNNKPTRKKPIEKDIWKMNPRQLKALMKKESYIPMSESERKDYDSSFDTAIRKVLG